MSPTVFWSCGRSPDCAALLRRILLSDMEFILGPFLRRMETQERRKGSERLDQIAGKS